MRNFIIYSIIITFFAICCRYQDDNDKILINVRVIEREQPRSKDLIIVRKVKKQFPMKKYIKILESETDDYGMFHFEAEESGRYSINVYGKDGSFNFREIEVKKLKLHEVIEIDLLGR